MKYTLLLIIGILLSTSTSAILPFVEDTYTCTNHVDEPKYCTRWMQTISGYTCRGYTSAIGGNFDTCLAWSRLADGSWGCSWMSITTSCGAWVQFTPTYYHCYYQIYMTDCDKWKIQDPYLMCTIRGTPKCDTWIESLGYYVCAEHTTQACSNIKKT